MIKLIAETAWHHEGDYDFMRNLLIKICNETKANIVKVHITLDLDEYMDHDHDVYDAVKSWMFTKDQWGELIGIVQDSDKELMLLLNDTKAIEFASKFNPDYVELHSVCMNVPYLQESIKNNINKNAKLVIGVGGSNLYEVDAVVESFFNREIILMFGFQNYPTEYENVNLDNVNKIQSIYQGKLYGYADHCGWDEPNNEVITLMVAANKMSYVEKHVTAYHGVERCDYSAAISVNMFNELEKKIRVLDEIRGSGSLELNAGEKTYSKYGPMKMAARLKKDVKEADILNETMIEFRRTKDVSDISQVEIRDFIGKKFRSNLSKKHVLQKGDFEK